MPLGNKRQRSPAGEPEDTSNKRVRRLRAMRKPIVSEDLQSRKRIPFGPEIREQLPCTWTSRGWTHRRHIISQHFLRAAWNKMAPDMNLLWLTGVAEKIVQIPQRLPGPNNAMSATMRKMVFASEILRQMNDNEHNLFVEDGGENSGIGAFSHKMDASLVVLRGLDSDTHLFTAARQKIVTDIEKSVGSWGRAARAHYEYVKQVILPLIKEAQSYSDLEELLEDAAYSTDLDMDKDKGGGGHAMLMRQRFREFIQGNGRVVDFERLIKDFVLKDWCGAAARRRGGAAASGSISRKTRSET